MARLLVFLPRPDQAELVTDAIPEPFLTLRLSAANEFVFGFAGQEIPCSPVFGDNPDTFTIDIAPVTAALVEISGYDEKEIRQRIALIFQTFVDQSPAVKKLFSAQAVPNSA